LSKNEVCVGQAIKSRILSIGFIFVKHVVSQTESAQVYNLINFGTSQWNERINSLIDNNKLHFPLVSLAYHNLQNFLKHNL